MLKLHGVLLVGRISAITGTGLLAVGVRKWPECQRVGVCWIALSNYFSCNGSSEAKTYTESFSFFSSPSWDL